MMSAMMLPSEDPLAIWALAERVVPL